MSSNRHSSPPCHLSRHGGGTFRCSDVELADALVDPERVEARVQALAMERGTAGSTSALADRRALRLAFDPLDIFRRNMGSYAGGQARCLYSLALIDLERNCNVRKKQLS